MLDLIIIAITPGIAFALLIYFTDRYDKEPLHLLIRLFIFGALSILPVLFIERVLDMLPLLVFNRLGIITDWTGHLPAIYTAFVVAGFTEEWVKRKVVLMTAYKHRAFNEKLDGIVYAVMVSLGFATVENIMYVAFRYAHIPTVGFQRAIFSVPAHMLFAITMGYYLSLAKYAENMKKRNYYRRLSLIIPILLHGIYDYILMAQSERLLMFFVPFVIFLWSYNLRKLNAYYKESKAIHASRNESNQGEN